MYLLKLREVLIMSLLDLLNQLLLSKSHNFEIDLIVHATCIPSQIYSSGTMVIGADAAPLVVTTSMLGT